MLYMHSRQSTIRILNALNVFRSVQENLNIYFLDLNGLPHSISEEVLKPRDPIDKQYEAYISGLFDESVYLSNPCMA